MLNNIELELNKNNMELLGSHSTMEWVCHTFASISEA